MLQLKDQYYLIFRIGNKEDFISINDLISFNLIEEAGNKVPTFDLEFYSIDPIINKYFTENNKIEVTMGRDQDDLIDIALMCSTVEWDLVSATQIRVYLAGYLNVPKYVNQSEIGITTGSGVEVLLNIAKKYFKTSKSTISGSSDSMNWIQYNTTDRDFINELWLHSNVSGSFPVVGITSNSNFIIKSMNSLLSETTKWTFTYESETNTRNNIIQYTVQPSISVNNGLINSWLGYNKTKYVLDLVSSEYSPLTPGPKTLMALNNNFNVSSLVTKSVTNPQLTNDNLDSNYWTSYINNTTNLGLFSTVIVDIVFTGPYYKIEVLDKVLFKQKSISEKMPSAEYETGIYIVSRVSRNISNSILTTSVRLCRENLNK